MSEYRQCELASGKRRQVAFIPLEFAKAGRWLVLDAETVNPWRVQHVYSKGIGPREHRNVFESIM